MNITFHGHSCVQIETEKTSLIIDPFLSGNPQFTGDVEDIKVDYILLTHGHGDHVGDTVAIAKKNDAQVITIVELANYLGWQGCKAHGMNIGGGFEFDFGHVKFTQAFHSSSVTDEDQQTNIYTGMPAGILLTIEGHCIFHAGDTSLFSDMKMIGELNRVDLAFLPIGDNFTMGPDDAYLAAQWINAEKVVPVHYNTFPLIKQDGQAFADRLKKKGIEGQVMEAGQMLSI